MAFIDPRTGIAFAALILAVVSQVIQRKLVDREKLKQNQEKMKQHQQKIKELSQKQDKQSKQEMERIEKEFMETANETMRATMKQMAISTPVFLAAFWFLGSIYSKETISLPIPLPWLGKTGIEMFNQTNWIGWYVVSALVSTIILNGIIKIYKNVKK